MHLHTENEAASLRNSKLRAGIEKIQKYVSKSKIKKLRITLRVIVTGIPITPQQFPTSSFLVARYHFLLP